MKVTKTEQKSKVTFKTTEQKKGDKAYQWWKAPSKEEMAQQLISTAVYLKENQQHRYRSAALYARLYGNQALFNFVGNNINKMNENSGLPVDRPTFNLVQSCVDSLVSSISQQRPSPVFLTDGSDYKERNTAKKLNNFIQGEFYQAEAYDKGTICLRDALVEGTGILKIYRKDNKVALDRILLTELLVDPNEAMYGDPRQLYQLKLVDRDVLLEAFPKFAKQIKDAEKAFPDNSPDSSRSIADQIMVVEGWHLPSGKDADDGMHVIACSSGIIMKDEYTKSKFPFVFLHFSPRLLGFWAQGLAEQLMGTQLEINQLLYTITKAIKLVGVPRVFIEAGSKVVKAHNNNDIGTIITYQGTKPSYEVAQCVPQELYAQLQRLIEYGYQQSGVSALQATSQKPAGLNSGEAIRSYNDISSDRMATLSRRFDKFYIDLAYAMMDEAMDIAKEEGSYQTIYPNKDGTKEIDLPKLDILKNPFIIQCFNMSSLPREPAGRLQKVTEMIQAGMLTVKEGRRLLDYPDLQQVEKLANASEERIFYHLDEIIEKGKYMPPDPFMNLELANELTVQYINLYLPAKLEEAKAQQLRDFYQQIQDIKAAAMPQAPQGAPATPQASPEALPTSPLIPNGPQSAAPAAAPAAA